jgi:hypothetical protein
MLNYSLEIQLATPVLKKSGKKVGNETVCRYTIVCVSVLLCVAVPDVSTSS